ncbi:MAG TPA: hypothetical protein VHJ20_01745 [Polyangia bacterium]|nr:hypothetical protein [Polyangia bacterium]
MSKANRPKRNSEAKKRLARIARKRWRKPTLAAMKAGETPEGVDRMLERELFEARYGVPKSKVSGS